MTLIAPYYPNDRRRVCRACGEPVHPIVAGCKTCGGKGHVIGGDQRQPCPGCRLRGAA